MLVCGAMLAIVMFVPQRAEAQILKKLSQGLEKVNNALDKVEKGVDDVMNGNVDGLFKSRKNKQKGGQAEEGDAAAQFDESGMESVEVMYPSPRVTDDTRFLQLPYVSSYTVSGVHDGVFAVQRDGAFSFWRVTGEKLFDYEWEYCSEMRSFGEKFPEFHNGVAVAREHAGMYSKGTIHLLYLDGSVMELDPDWSQVSQFEDGLAVVTDKSNFTTKYFYINPRGEKVFPNLEINGDDNWSIRPIRDGLRAYASGCYSWGYIDVDGNIKLNPQYGGAADFSEGYAWVVLKKDPNSLFSDGEIVLIDTKGEVVFRSGLTWSGSDFKNFYQQKVSDVVDGCFYVREADDNYHYYNTKFEEIGIAEYGTPYYNGMAFIAPLVDLDCDVCVVDTDFKVVRRLKDDMMFATDLRTMPRFGKLGVASVHNKSISSYVMNSSGGVILEAYEVDNDCIDSFWQFTESRMMRATDVKLGGENYKAIVNDRGEVEWLFGEYPIGVIVVEDNPIERKKKETIDYNVTVRCEPAEGGSATLSPKSKFKYAEEGVLSATPNSDWAVSYIEVGGGYYGFAPKLNEPFYVTEDMEIIVHFAKREEELAPPIGDYFAGVKSFDICDGYKVDVTIYAEIDDRRDISTVYGDYTYGFIVAMFDPTYRFVTPNIATYIFGAPLKIHSYQYDEESGQRWLVVDGGSYTFGNLKLTPNNDNGLGALMLSMMLACDGYSSPEMAPRHYRIEMLDYDTKTGEFTCGKLQTYSPRYGWLWGGDERLAIKSKGVFFSASDSGIPDDLFEGVRMKCAEKRNDVWWYPPLLWYDGQQSVLDGVVEQMGRAYREFKTDYDELFGE